jgi:hypothetical protein
MSPVDSKPKNGLYCQFGLPLLIRWDHVGTDTPNSEALLGGISLSPLL